MASFDFDGDQPSDSEIVQRLESSLNLLADARRIEIPIMARVVIEDGKPSQIV